MINLDIFVVLYKRQIDASETLVSLRRLDFVTLGFDVEVHIWDNSPTPLWPEQGTLPPNWRYISSTSNDALSKAYNTLIRGTSRSYVMIFDQDSCVTETLFLRLRAGIEEVIADVFVPMIKHDGRVISPGRLRWIKGAPLRAVHPGALLPKNFTAMMSGLCISRSALLRHGAQPFDERLRFYGIDTRFCRDLSQHGGAAYLYDAVLEHDSALRSTADRDAALERQIWLWQSWLQVFDRNLAESIAIRFYVLWKVLQVSCRPGSQRKFGELASKVLR
jgi:GT2 family glycosyltransferase